ncbi:LuxR C-terminal-related transcriptional regulator [Nocardia asteroides]|uniref:LuxR C-terminal-related transcriptional regulator n=1 Tax=Nocardia asteroides TaxID=1824 RepID=UPI001E620AC9|nr:LuxR C-terminal-related transcriptional regulator [Nocardia asteroides]UGT63713.1 LuxR C-terminal-related transcriptional regulator [Nocardia asteroides]
MSPDRVPGEHLLRPRDGDALRAALRLVAREAGVPVAFGGEIARDALLLSEFVGTTTNALRGLTVLRMSGLGGQVMASGSPASVADYRSASSITHDYDRPVLGEGIRSVLAVPVLVERQSRAVLYAANRGGSPLGGRTAELMIGAARQLAREITVRDEVDRRLRLLRLAEPAPAGAESEELRDIHAELREIAAAVPDPELRARLDTVGGRITHVLAGAPAADAPRLSRRELDVLAQVALGCTNQEVATRLSLGPETVKSYLRSAMSKLDAHTRVEAVARARRARLLP